MAKNVNLNKLRDEIDNRKKERNIVSSRLGESTGSNIAPRDTFLNGLLESLQTGKETASSVLVKTVENKFAVKKGETTQLPIRNTQPVQQPNRINLGEQIDMSPERDEQLFADLEKKRKMTIAESLEQYSKVPQVGTPMAQQINTTGTPMQLNEVYLAESVKKVVNNYLAENLEPIFEEAIKNTIIEMYAVERIKEVLKENKEMIKTIVVETIREIQARSKAKAQS